MNIDRAVTLGQEQMEALESSWPEGFYNTIKRQVVTFSGNRKAVKVGDVTIIDQEAIYTRVIVWHGSPCHKDFLILLNVAQLRKFIFF